MTSPVMPSMSRPALAWQDWCQVSDYKESLIGKVSGDTFYQTSESMSVASLELTFTIIRQVLLHFMIILLQYVFFNFKVCELYVRGNFPAPIETWLLHSRGSPLSIRDVSPNWTTYLFWSLFTPQAPALPWHALPNQGSRLNMLRKKMEELLLQWPIDKSGAQFREDGGPDDTVLPCPVLSIKSSTRSCGEERPGLR